MLELRTDYLENLNVDLVRNLIAEIKSAVGKPLPLVVTCRDQRQGGANSYPQQLRIDILAAAIKAGVEFIDIEFDNFIRTENQERIRVALSQSIKGRLILSAHNFSTKFEDIKKLYRSIMTLYPVAIPKLVYTANHINDCFYALDLLQQTAGERIVFCMGEAGLISRILAKKLGSFLTFASINEQKATAPGQLTIAQLKVLYRYDSISTNSELFGVIADPVGHSLSPAIHNVFFAEAVMNKLYLPLLVQGGRDKFDEFLSNVLYRGWLNFKGFSVTIPHKENALNYVKARGGFIEPLAEKIGAVNTLVIERQVTSNERKIRAYNTDYEAALDAITSALKVERTDLKDMPVAIIGAGGVARAIVAGLCDVGAKVKIYNRTVERAEKLAADFGCEFTGLDDLTNLDAKLLINCTSIGMHPDVDAIPVPVEYLKKGMTIFDTVYNPAQTKLLKQAKSKRLKTIDGVSMFINQAAAQFKLFTGQDANVKLMLKTITNFL
ncbi:MAG: shikimate dehydrogenase [Planctomycetes bacterium RBG_13_44_8b]|nr:MAG: shikimate dehydrogenase [Planctomycetes bacterium RBG_13_44_8b]